MTEFEWPWQYSFPPFFTLQPNEETRRKQLEAWCQLVISHCRWSRVFTLSVADSSLSPLFNNTSLKRQLSQQMIRIVLDQLAEAKQIEWIDKNKSSCHVFWRSAVDWGQLIYGWVNDRGLANSVCTLYELSHGDDTTGQDFHGLPDSILIAALKSLESAGRAELMLDGGGVKFF